MIPVESDLVQLLMEVGYLAGGHGFFDRAETIFSGLEAIRPESEYPIIGLAVTRMNAGYPEEAAGILRHRGLRTAPNSLDVKSFLGLALKLYGLKHESWTLLQEVVEEGPQTPAGHMAHQLLQELTT